jgi:hypothetical protein
MNHSVDSDEALVALLQRTMHEVSMSAPDMELSTTAGNQRWMVSAAAATVIVVGVGAAGLAVTSRSGSSDRISSSSPSTVPFASTTTDPLSDLNLPDGTVPDDAILRFTSSLGQFGQLWVYDSATTDEIYLLRQGPSGNSFGSMDRGTYESGQGWSLEGNHGVDLLYGLAPTSLRVTVTFGDTTVISDENGLWYTPAPHDLPGFTLKTGDTSTYIDLVTSSEMSQTTVVTAST